jgi:polar amino acid transport system ATP-binding protein
VDDEEITDPKVDINRIRQKMGMVFQQFNLFPHLKIIDNITLAPVLLKKMTKEDAEKRALELLDRVGLRDKADSYPASLSGGQKQRVAIVRALLMHPEVLLFDEVTAALDPEMVHEVLETMLRLAKSGSTMLIVTHEMSFAEAVADRILFFDNGEIVEEAEDVRGFFKEPKTERARKFLRTFEYDSALYI